MSLIREMMSRCCNLVFFRRQPATCEGYTTMDNDTVVSLEKTIEESGPEQSARRRRPLRTPSPPNPPGGGLKPVPFSLPYPGTAHLGKQIFLIGCFYRSPVRVCSGINKKFDFFHLAYILPQAWYRIMPTLPVPYWRFQEIVSIWIIILY